MLGHPPEVSAYAARDLIVRARCLTCRRNDQEEEPLASFIEQRHVQLAFRFEVLVEHRLGHPGRLGNIVHGRAVEALL